jgi:hypothetical protein
MDQQDNLSGLADIDPIVTGYQNAIRAMLSISVPQSLASQDLNLVNALSLMLYVSQGFRHTDTDPMQSYLAVQTYQEAQDSLNSALLAIQSYFNAAHISFSTTEQGILFSTIISNQ